MVMAKRGRGWRGEVEGEKPPPAVTLIAIPRDNKTGQASEKQKTPEQLFAFREFLFFF